MLKSDGIARMASAIFAMVAESIPVFTGASVQGPPRPVQRPWYGCAPASAGRGFSPWLSSNASSSVRWIFASIASTVSLATAFSLSSRSV
jgi:hypothetical protein